MIIYKTKYIKSICELPCPKIFHNAQYDVGWLEREGFKVNGEIIDTMIAAAIVDENRFSYSLNALSKDYLGEIKAETDLINAAGRSGRPVNVKKGQFLAPWDITPIANKLRSVGCDEFLFTERDKIK